MIQEERGRLIRDSVSVLLRCRISRSIHPSEVTLHSHGVAKWLSVARSRLTGRKVVVIVSPSRLCIPNRWIFENTGQEHRPIAENTANTFKCLIGNLVSSEIKRKLILHSSMGITYQAVTNSSIYTRIQDGLPVDSADNSVL
jgi:hypothetical protein